MKLILPVSCLIVGFLSAWFIQNERINRLSNTLIAQYLLKLTNDELKELALEKEVGASFRALPEESLKLNDKMSEANSREGTEEASVSETVISKEKNLSENTQQIINNHLISNEGSMNSKYVGEKNDDYVSPNKLKVIHTVLAEKENPNGINEDNLEAFLRKKAHSPYVQMSDVEKRRNLDEQGAGGVKKGMDHASGYPSS